MVGVPRGLWRDVAAASAIRAAGANGGDAAVGRCVISSYVVKIDQEDAMAAGDTTKLSSKYQISIPKSVRVAQGWRAGQVFAFIPKGDGMLLVPVPKLEALAGIARGAKPHLYRDRSDRT
jgi:AbrB family looped-hinge helix DNA binding protein